jgi:hypothetical protein
VTTFGKTIPSVLTPAPPLSSISTERALKQVLSLLEYVIPDDVRERDMLEASIDDVKTMLSCVDRGQL